MSSEALILLISSVFAGFAGLIASVMTNRTAATKTQLDALAEVVKLLQSDNSRIIAENKRLEAKIDHLECEIEEKDGSIAHLKRWAELLVRTLQDNRIPVPPMPEKEKTKPR